MLTLFIFLTISTTSSAQATITYVKSLCEKKASSWMDKLGLSYRGGLSLSEVEELKNGKIKVAGMFYISISCGITTSCTFEAELEKALDKFEVTSMCRNAPICAGLQIIREYKCFPN